MILSAPPYPTPLLRVTSRGRGYEEPQDYITAMFEYEFPTRTTILQLFNPRVQIDFVTASQPGIPRLQGYRSNRAAPRAIHGAGSGLNDEHSGALRL